jgi:hypothetical protein
MFITLQETVQENVRPATDELTELLAGLGFGADRLDSELELAIDRFDQWTNPLGAGMFSSCGDWHDTDEETESERAS